jgi:hypothetical protein
MIWTGGWRKGEVVMVFNPIRCKRTGQALGSGDNGNGGLCLCTGYAECCIPVDDPRFPPISIRPSPERLARLWHEACGKVLEGDHLGRFARVLPWNELTREYQQAVIAGMRAVLDEIERTRKILSRILDCRF